MMYTSVEELLNFVNNSTSPWHTVETAADMLSKESFQELDWRSKWEKGLKGRFFTKIYGSSLIAFTLGENEGRLRISAAHTDFPGFRIKPKAGIIKEGYGMLNIEGYGGMILSTWLDRPLSMAGKIVLRGENVFAPEVRLVDFARPLMTIPSLAIHMNRKVNDGVELNKQKHMLPLTSVLGKLGEKSFFDDFLANELGVNAKDILSYELNVYPFESSCQLGLAGELVSAGRLDNITSCVACLKGIVNADISCGTNVAVLFDNEEIGSRTKQGAASAVLMQFLERIYKLQEKDNEELWQDIANGFMLSVDVAHGVHPNYSEKADPTCRPVLNGGVVLKEAASQSYAGDAEAVAVIGELCNVNNIPYQHFVNRSDSPGGSTLGSIASALVPIRTMDIGLPILAMHSARETMGAADQDALNNLLIEFYH